MAQSPKLLDFCRLTARVEHRYIWKVTEIVIKKIGGVGMFYIDSYGDTGLRIQFSETISKATNEKIRCFCALLEREKIAGIIEWIPTYNAVSIIYNPFVILNGDLKNKVEALRDQLEKVELPQAEIVQIPVLYGDEAGPDLTTIARQHKLDETEVISIHSGTNYLIYMMGFIPGFAYLGEMSKKIAAPRKSNPNAAISPGSVGIAGEQTGIYPLKSPGGWNIIGKTPVKLYDGNKESPILLKSGNYVRFVPITQQEFHQIEQEVEVGNYIPHIETYQDKRQE